MTRDERRRMFARLDAATSTETGFSVTERENHVQAIYLKCVESKTLGTLSHRYSPTGRELLRSLRRTNGR